LIRYYIGIDPGKTGAIGLVKPGGRKVLVYDTPTPQDLNRHLTNCVGPRGSAVAVIEDVHAMPKQGVSSTFKFGKSFGEAIGVLVAWGIPLDYVRPQVWKKMFGLVRKDKDDSRRKARELWPYMDEKLKRKKDDGRAEALLIAEYCRRTYS
tara:strand:+ start:1080 stop:1532 length:453 start_codon:yes stop_codon:yes gene_type:complete